MKSLFQYTPARILKNSVRKVLNLIDPDLEYKMIDQYQFSKRKRRPPDLMWKPVAPNPEARLDAGRAQIGHELLVFCGFLWHGRVVNKVDIFDLNKERWTERFDLPADMAQTHLGVADDGKRYVYMVS